jgi:sigma-B regulation protein RsbU (phosphoserine phosphatase)
VLGLLPADEIHSETLDLDAGDAFVLFTDGVSEAFDPNGDLFGEDRLLAYLDTANGQKACDMAHGILDAVRRHAAGAKQSDDITVMCVRYAGA